MYTFTKFIKIVRFYRKSISQVKIIGLAIIWDRSLFRICLFIQVQSLFFRLLSILIKAPKCILLHLLLFCSKIYFASENLRLVTICHRTLFQDSLSFRSYLEDLIQIKLKLLLRYKSYLRHLVGKIVANIIFCGKCILL